MNRLFSNDIEPLRFARDLGLRLVDRAPALKRWFAAEAAGAGARAPRLLRGAGPDERVQPEHDRRAGARAASTRRRARVVPPLHVATTFIRDPDNGYSSGNIYGRPDNPTVREAEAIIGALEGAVDDAAVRLRHVGLDRAVSRPRARRAYRRAARDVLGPAQLARSTRRSLHGLEVSFCDAEDLADLASAVRPGRTKLVWLETPEQSALGRQRHRGRRADRAGGGRGPRRRLRPARRRCSRSPWRSAPTSSCIRRPNI